MNDAAADLRYPIGRFEPPGRITERERRRWLDDLAKAPEQLRAAAAGLTSAQLDTPYRPGGWTVRQVLHHVPDSHVNAYVRVKLALTEERPTIKPYDEGAWAELADAKRGPVEPALVMLEVVHARLLAVLADLDEERWKRTFFHPERNATLSLDWVVGMYAWHGAHHTAHVTALRARQGW